MEGCVVVRRLRNLCFFAHLCPVMSGANKNKNSLELIELSSINKASLV
jgi:hypothetical protein